MDTRFSVVVPRVSLELMLMSLCSMRLNLYVFLSLSDDAWVSNPLCVKTVWDRTAQFLTGADANAVIEL
jgi:hypothetical protein